MLLHKSHLDHQIMKPSIKHFFPLALLVCALMAGRASAQVTAAVPFLQVEPDAKITGMGNAGAALAENANAVFWNPAGLAFNKNTELSISHSNWLPRLASDLFYEYLIGKYHVDGLGTFGASVTYMNLGENERRNEANEPDGTFRSYDAAANVSYGFKVTPNLSVGTGIRFIYSNLDSGGGSVGTQKTQAGISAGADLAVQYRSNPISLGGIKTKIAAGANLANMGPAIQYSDRGQSDPIPTNLRVGLASTFSLDDYNTFSIAVDANKVLIHTTKDEATGEYKSDPFYKAIFSSWQPLTVNIAAQGQDPVYKNLSSLDQMTFGFGVDYTYRQFFSIRGGYFYENPYNGDRQFFTTGFGLNVSVVQLDVSYIITVKEQHPLEGTPRFSIGLNL